jgi:fumarylacetoacetase
VTSVTGFGVFSVAGEPPRIGFLAGDRIVDLAAAGLGSEFEQPSLNPLLAGGRTAWEDALGQALELVEADEGPRVPLAHATLSLPFEVADYVDFYSSLEHATNLGRMFRPD